MFKWSIYVANHKILFHIQTQEDGQLVLDAVIIKGRLHVRDFREVMFQCQNLVEVFVNGVPISAEDAAAGFWTFLGEFYLDAVSFYVGLDIADGWSQERTPDSVDKCWDSSVKRCKVCDLICDLKCKEVNVWKLWAWVFVLCTGRKPPYKGDNCLWSSGKAVITSSQKCQINNTHEAWEPRWFVKTTLWGWSVCDLRHRQVQGLCIVNAEHCAVIHCRALQDSAHLKLCM